MIETPFKELLAHLITKIENDIQEAEKEQMDYYMNFIALLKSNPQSKKASDDTERFMRAIEPKRKQEPKFDDSGPQWNERVQKKIEAKQREREKKEQVTS